MRHSTSPFIGAATRYAELSAVLNSYASTMVALSAPGSGATAQALQSRLEGRATTVSEMSQGASTVAEECTDQATADIELTGAPSVSEVEDLRADVTAASQDLASGNGSAEDLDAARDAYQDAKSRYDEARRVHEEKTGGTAFPDTSFGNDSTEASGNGAAGGGTSSGGSAGGGSPASSGGSSMSGLDDSSGGDSLAGDTELSSDTAAAGGSPMLGGAAPQQPQMAQAPPQPQMAPMQPQPQQPNTGAATGPYSGVRDTAKSARDLASRYGGSGVPRLDTSIGTSTSGASGPIDRGSSIGSQTTRADVSGSSSTALSSGTTGQPGQGGQQNQGMMRGGMGMGGMPMGGMGAGGAGGKAKERPNILTTDSELLGTDDMEQSVAGGVLGRDTSTAPNQP